MLSLLQKSMQESECMKNMVFAETLKYRYNRGERSNLHYYRDSRGNEVDLLIDAGGKLSPVEIKSGTTAVKEIFSSIDILTRAPGVTACPGGAVVYGGLDSYVFKNHSVTAYNSVHRLMSNICDGTAI